MSKNNIWVSEQDLTQNAEYHKAAQQEFFELPIVDGLSEDAEVIEEATKGSNRRDFLKYLGFGLGAATIAASCEIPVKKAVPYVVKPDAIVPGVATYYASSFVRGGDYCPVIVKTREGRPIKIEGNSMSPMTGGGTSARAQASVLDLYDKSRLRYASALKNNKRERILWADLDKEVKAALTADAQVRIVANTIMSPTVKKAIEEFTAKYPNTKVATYDAVSSAGMLLANEATFGQRAIPSYHFDKAEVIVNFGADFLGTWVSPVEYAHAFAKTRKVDPHHPKMSRLIQFESGMSLTGSNADSRVHIKPSETDAAILALHNELLGGGDVAGLSAKAKAGVKAAAADLKKAQGKAIVVSATNDTNAQILVNKINNFLGSYGSTITFDRTSNQRQGIDSEMQDLIGEMNGGSVDVVIVLGDANPAYDIPNADKFAEALAKVGVSVSLSTNMNETGAKCKFSAPGHHYLESWGDVEPKSGHYSLIQPTISPLFKTRPEIVSLLTWADSEVVANSERPDYDYLKQNWEANMFPQQSDFSTFNAFWDNALHDGLFEAPANGTASFTDVPVDASKIAKPSTGEAIEVSFFEPIGVGNGAYANNPWLQEMPDPITRVVWDNPLQVPITWESGRKYTRFNNLQDGDMAEVTIGGNSIKKAITNQFGQMAGTVAMALGYGRTVAGQAGTGVGTNAYQFLTINKNTGTTQYYAVGVEVSKKKGEDKTYASVQDHHTYGVSADIEGESVNVDEDKVLGFKGALTERSVVYMTDMSQLESEVERVQEKRAEAQKLNSHTLYPGFDSMYAQGHHWGMNVDLNACIGCGACQVACIAENNVPIVGKKEVSRKHEMTWLRIDRYYFGDVENPNVVYQPMMCQHCDNAPCENVCPVNATNHSAEGLNQMTYNRCIGTRYCANNCPYKVRRFNWLDYTSADIFPWNEAEYTEDDVYMGDMLTRMVLNPDVTVRSRGVIEKCSFCVQRIQESKLTAKRESRKLRDGEMKTACQTACPTGAIVFGDINDHSSEVHKKNESDLNFIALEEINVKSSVGYLMKVTNKNEAIG